MGQSVTERNITGWKIKERIVGEPIVTNTCALLPFFEVASLMHNSYCTQKMMYQMRRMLRH